MGRVFTGDIEKSAIRLICPDLDRAWIPMGGEPDVGRLGKPLKPQKVAVAKDKVLHAN